MLVDRSPPRVDSARCISLTCVDDGFGELLTRAADARVDLGLQTFDAFTAVTRVEVTFEPALDQGPQVVPVTAGSLRGVLVPAGQGSTMSLTPIDAVDNRGEAFVRAVRHDVTGPVIANVAIEGGDATTNKTQVTVTVSVPAGDAVDMRLSPTETFNGGFTAFRDAEFFTFAGDDGDRQVCVQVRDAAQNTSVACDTIALDRTPPTGSVVVADTDAITSAARVNVELVYPADAVEVFASAQALTCEPTTTPYEDATGSPQQFEVDLPGGDGVRTIFACFRDGAGNIASATDTLTIDRTAPTASLRLNGGAAFATSTGVVAQIATDADVVKHALSVDSALNCATAAYVDFEAAPSVSLPSAQGPHVVRVCVEDAAGNRSALAAEASITLDTQAPNASVVINGGAAFTTSATVSLSVTASPDVVAIAVENVPTLLCSSAVYTSFSPAARGR